MPMRIFGQSPYRPATRVTLGWVQTGYPGIHPALLFWNQVWKSWLLGTEANQQTEKSIRRRKASNSAEYMQHSHSPTVASDVALSEAQWIQQVPILGKSRKTSPLARESKVFHTL
jgi:hypothetical protein